MLINTTTDLQSAEVSPEQKAFLTAMLNDYIVFDDAVYPEGYQMKNLQPEDDGYIAPVIRKEWNAGAAAVWGFANRAAIEAALS